MLRQTRLNNSSSGLFEDDDEESENYLSTLGQLVLGQSPRLSSEGNMLNEEFASGDSGTSDNDNNENLPEPKNDGDQSLSDKPAEGTLPDIDLTKMFSDIKAKASSIKALL